MKREHAWLPNMSCEHCGCWGLTYEARMECRADVEPEAAEAPNAPIDWLKITGDFA